MSLGEVLALVGLGIAIWQVLRAQTLTHATYEAVQETSRQFGNYSLLMLIPELARIEAECEASAMCGDSESIRRHMQDWRDRAGELRGFLNDHDEDASELLHDLQRSLGATRDTKRDLAVSSDLIQLTSHLRDSMTQVCQSARTYGANMRVATDLPAPPPSIGGWIRKKLRSRGKDL